MSRRRVVFSHRARQDLDRIGSEGRKLWGPERTRNYLAALRDTANRLPDFPELHPALAIPIAGLRKARSGAHLLVYRLANERIEVIRVLHARMDATGQLGE